MTGRNVFLTFGCIIKMLSIGLSILPYRVRLYLFRSVSGLGGVIGILIRYILFSKLIKQCGKNVVIKKHVYLYDIKEMKCGNNVSIHEMCYLNAIGGLTIGNDVSIAHGTSVLTTNHTWADVRKPIKYNDIEEKSVLINDDVWIGCGARIMAGVTIGKRSIVASGAVVTKNVECGTIVGGCPASVIKRINL